LLKPLGKGPPESFRVLDLGAAPGSWSLYVLRQAAPVKGSAASRNGASDNHGDTGNALFLAAVDLAPLSRQYDKGLFDGEIFFFIQGDMTAPETRAALLEKGPYQLVISDAAPATTGNRSVDTLRSLELAETALDYAEAALAPGGNLAVKVFQGGDTGGFLKRIRSLFETGKSFKPQACRSESFETYYLGLGKR
jgi:23S rRNA (uridine2552-2'-O)-methyltransferase